MPDRATELKEAIDKAKALAGKQSSELKEKRTLLKKARQGSFDKAAKLRKLHRDLSKAKREAQQRSIESGFEKRQGTHLATRRAEVNKSILKAQADSTRLKVTLRRLETATATAKKKAPRQQRLRKALHRHAAEVSKQIDAMEKSKRVAFANFEAAKRSSFEATNAAEDAHATGKVVLTRLKRENAKPWPGMITKQANVVVSEATTQMASAVKAAGQSVRKAKPAKKRAKKASPGSNPKASALSLLDEGESSAQAMARANEDCAAVCLSSTAYGFTGCMEECQSKHTRGVLLGETKKKTAPKLTKEQRHLATIAKHCAFSEEASDMATRNKALERVSQLTESLLQVRAEKEKASPHMVFEGKVAQNGSKNYDNTSMECACIRDCTTADYKCLHGCTNPW